MPSDPSLNISITVSGAGGNISQTFNRSADSAINHNIAIPAAKTGTLTTRTDNDTGVITLGVSASISTGAVVDVYWSTGRRYGVTVGTVSGTSCPIDLGAGDNLPSTSTAVTISPQITVVTTIDGDNLSLLSFKQHYNDTTVTSASHLDLLDDADAEVVGLTLNANEVKLYDITGGATNVFTGNIITQLKCSNKSSAAAAILQVLGVQDGSS